MGRLSYFSFLIGVAGFWMPKYAGKYLPFTAQNVAKANYVRICYFSQSGTIKCSEELYDIYKKALI